MGVLLSTAATLACVHTLLGVDHSLPFIVLGRARRWSLRHTLFVTGLCGTGHVASSVVIGVVGIGLGLTVDGMAWLESSRGDLAAALLMGFGLAYACWAGWRRLRQREHSHVHAHADGTVHRHPHGHHGEHLHVHGSDLKRVTPWALFIIFAFGPCEPLIPLMLVPAFGGNWLGVAAVVAVFGALTVATMLATVAVGHVGVRVDRLGRVGDYGDVIAGLIITASGAAVLLLDI